MKDEKLIRKFLTDDQHITMSDCDRLLTSFDYKLHKSGGSHRVYHKGGEHALIVVTPHHTKYVKPGYVKLLVKKLKLEEDDGN